MKPSLSLVPALFLLAACNSAPVFDAGSANLTNAPAEDLCRTLGEHHPRAPEVRAELERRQTLTAEEWVAVGSGRLTAGMSACALYASFPVSQAWSMKKYWDAQDRQTGEDLAWECKTKPMQPFCPATRYDIRNGTIRAIVKLNSY